MNIISTVFLERAYENLQKNLSEATPSAHISLTLPALPIRFVDWKELSPACSRKSHGHFDGTTMSCGNKRPCLVERIGFIYITFMKKKCLGEWWTYNFKPPIFPLEESIKEPTK